MNKDILVVDDELDVREYLRDLLEDNGYTVVIAKDGIEAMEALHQKTPDLILLDLMMPGETGTGFYRKLRAHGEYKTIPVIVISGLAGRNVAVSKSIPVLDKPIDEERLLATIDEQFG